MSAPTRTRATLPRRAQKVYWKYHITAVLGLQIILAAMATPGSLNDVNMLVFMLGGV